MTSPTQYTGAMPNPNPKRPPLDVALRALGVEALRPGEDSRKVRIRAPIKVLEVLESLTPQERGQVVREGLVALGLWKEVGDEEAQAGK